MKNIGLDWIELKKKVIKKSHGEMTLNDVEQIGVNFINFTGCNLLFLYLFFAEEIKFEVIKGLVELGNDVNLEI
jgi:hypothetical protein